jgi:hypothetical protein
MSLEATIKLVPRFFRRISLVASLLLLAFPHPKGIGQTDDITLMAINF